MNPFDLPGPAFLKFYIVFVAIVIALGRWLRYQLQQSEPPGRSTGRFTEGYYPREGEVYHIAYLRGGATELEHTARVLDATRATTEPQDEPVRAPHAAQIENELEREGLILDSAQRGPFVRVMVVAVFLLIGVAGVKIGVALSQGRSNIGYLLVLTIALSAAAVIALRPPRVTKAGRTYLTWADGAHNGLLSLVNQGRRTTPGEVALCAALYGLAPLTIEPVARLKSMLRAEAAKRDGGSASGCGSSSGGSSCGGGCGGGGCGGCGG
jgi:uncharacterized membrane protein YgcG